MTPSLGITRKSGTPFGGIECSSSWGFIFEATDFIFTRRTHTQFSVIDLYLTLYLAQVRKYDRVSPWKKISSYLWGQRMYRSACVWIQSDYNIPCPYKLPTNPWLFIGQIVKALTTMSGCIGISESSLGAFCRKTFFSERGSCIVAYQGYYQCLTQWHEPELKCGWPGYVLSYCISRYLPETILHKSINRSNSCIYM